MFVFHPNISEGKVLNLSKVFAYKINQGSRSVKFWLVNDEEEVFYFDTKKETKAFYEALIELTSLTDLEKTFNNKLKNYGKRNNKN